MHSIKSCNQIPLSPQGANVVEPVSMLVQQSWQYTELDGRII